ncbi:Crp/Fnr family transcriptional regulator [Zobellia galactanivorans]|uniref:Crp/Fnr family transcriptional regulator n=1 Tax=Zobellia galactanivorans (strain DSM 12802 / CCUG 47099 / CIP 106680 / NCIMB 13871 / Dsij) TaxID=63186 RepID=UPI0026E477CF|nr:Crp/Fnr family transcriptional regulator [Zobellia galactanivorans]MDO6808470.1 Crp/Fnr family transcriptional regulator [Zobellia galactanivorans]
MNSTSLKSFLTSHLNVDEQDILTLLSHCTTKKVKKDTFLLQKNERCSHTFFVEKGLLRHYSIDEKGKEHILAFAPESWFVTDRESSYFNAPSAYYIQALEDSQIVLIDENFIQGLSEKVPSFTNFNNRLLHNHIRHLQRRVNTLLSDSAKERYLQFIKTYPDILIRVPQTMVASYLGITPESLSRVRRELARKNQVNYLGASSRGIKKNTP